MDQDQKPNMLPNGKSGPRPEKSERLRKITQLGTDFVNLLIQEVSNELDKNRKTQSDFKSWCHQRCENVHGRVKELEGTVKELQKQVAVKDDVIKSLEAKFDQLKEDQVKATAAPRPSSTQTKSTYTTNLEPSKEEKLDRLHSGYQHPQNQAARTSGPVKNPNKSVNLLPVPALHPMADTNLRGDQRPSLEALLNKMPPIPDRYRTSWDVRTETAAATSQSPNRSLEENRKRKASDGGYSDRDLLYPEPKRKRPTFGQKEEMINCMQAKIAAGHSEGIALMSIFNDPKFKDWGEKTIQGVWLQRDEILEIMKTKPHLKDKKNIKRISEAAGRSESEDDGGLQLPMPSYTPWLNDYFQYFNSQK